MMKLNQIGEKKASIEKHLEEHYALLSEWETKDINANRVNGLKSIIRGRQIALQSLDDMDTDTVTVRTGTSSDYEPDLYKL